MIVKHFNPYFLKKFEWNFKYTTKNTNDYFSLSIIITHTYKEATKKYKNGIKRVMSLFKTGLFLLNIAYNSRIKVRLPFSFILYDI